MSVTVGGKRVGFCTFCHGSGVDQNSTAGVCGFCGGKGYVDNGTIVSAPPNLELNLRVVNNQLLDVLQQRDELQQRVEKQERFIASLEKQIKDNADVYCEVKRERDGLIKALVALGGRLPDKK